MLCHIISWKFVTTCRMSQLLQHPCNVIKLWEFLNRIMQRTISITTSANNIHVLSYACVECLAICSAYVCTFGVAPSA